jgi:hypothetical protein
MESLPDDKVMCHHTGFEKSCRDMVINGRCRKWVQIQGANPNTGELVNKWDCADAWLPLLLIENAQQTRQAGAAIESFRNETVAANERVVRSLSQSFARAPLLHDSPVEAVVLPPASPSDV